MPAKRGRSVKDLSGQRFGRYLVVRLSGTRPMGKTGKLYYVWECHCDCGQVKIVVGNSLSQGATVSCGCFKNENTRARRTIHGESRSLTPEYRSYNSARQRCNCPSNPAYPRYGGRGIEFRFASYPEFLTYMGRKPSPQHSLDRIDNEGHYEPGNLRWATYAEQGNNRRPHIRRRYAVCLHCSEKVYGLRPTHISTGLVEKRASRGAGGKAPPPLTGGESPEQVSYRGAKSRCENPNDVSAWPHYGGRGIEFRFPSFEAFLAEVGRKPTPLHSLDRIDVNGHYEPGNLKWATSQEQNRNRRPRANVTFVTCPHCGGKIIGYRMTNKRMRPSTTPRPAS